MSVCPYLIDIAKEADIGGPLSKFQARKADREGTLVLIKDINRALEGEAMPEDRLTRIFDRFWPELEEKIQTIPTSPAQKVKREDRELLEDILDGVRFLTRLFGETPEFPSLTDFFNPATQAANPLYWAPGYRKSLLPNRQVRALLGAIARMDPESREKLLQGPGEVAQPANQNKAEGEGQA